MQFSGTVEGLNGVPTYRIGTTSGTWLSLEEDNDVGVEGWGWTDNGFGMNVFGPDLWFERTGPQTVRLQPREDGIVIDQIVLSASQYLATAPGVSKNSPTILAANDGGGAPPPPPTALCGTLPPNVLPALAWNPAEGATGYTVHYGTASGQYTATVDVENALLWSVPARPEWYLSVRAYNSAGVSGYSSEVNTSGQ